MNYRNIIYILFLILFSCTEDSKKINYSKNFEHYSNKGFTLVYDDSLLNKKFINKKLDDRSLLIFNNNLAKETPVRITNLLNGKYLMAKVSKNANYPFFYNSVISKRIFDELELNELEPYVEISTISENSTFLAKKAKMYEEEKNVAEKVPVEGVSISDLSSNKKKAEKKQKKVKFTYIIKIADFYYLDTAKLMQKRIIDELNLDSSGIIKISNTNFRVYLGPFNNLKSLKNAYDDITPLNFENIEIIKL